MMALESDVELSRLIAALPVLYGINSDAEIAEAIAEAGYEVSQQSVNNYKRGRKNPPVGFIVAFVKALELDIDQRRQVLRAYMNDNPEQEDFIRLWASL